MMRNTLILLWISLSFPLGVFAMGEMRLSNENWLSLPHPQVISFIVHEDGSAEGLTEGNIPFIQYNLSNELGIRIQRFEIQDHYHYIVEGEVVYSEEELVEKLTSLTH